MKKRLPRDKRRYVREIAVIDPIENPPASLVTIYKEIRTIKEAVYRERRGYTDAERQRLDDLIPHSFSRFNSLVGDTFVESLLELDLH